MDIPARLRAPLRVCSAKGCANRVREGKCSTCARGRDRERGSSHQRGYTTREWGPARKAYLTQHPLCVGCLPRVVPATVVDHITPHRGDTSLFWDRGNWQGLCASCHSRKTAREDGGFGNRGA